MNNETATVGLPDLREGNIGLICATIFCPPGKYRSFGYTTAEEARQTAMIQLNWYRQQVEAGLLNFVKSKRDLPSPTDETVAGPLAAIMLMEGADALSIPGRCSRMVRIWPAHRGPGVAAHPQRRRHG